MCDNAAHHGVLSELTRQRWCLTLQQERLTYDAFMAWDGWNHCSGRRGSLSKRAENVKVWVFTST
jgi:hypothetical protein